MLKESPETVLFDRLLGNEHAIEASEARGQAKLCASSVLPEEGRTRPGVAELGIEWGELVEGDPLFRHAKLPAGWKLQATDHAMHNALIDEKGRKRAGVRYAHIYACTRYRINYWGPGEAGDYDRTNYQRVVLDGNKELFRKSVHVGDATGDAYGALIDPVDKACRDYLVSIGRPDWENPAAYWEVE